MTIQQTYVCDKCGKTFPLYINGEFNQGLAYNLGFGTFEFCSECEPVKNAEEIIESIDLAINPIKEIP